MFEHVEDGSVVACGGDVDDFECPLGDFDYLALYEIVHFGFFFAVFVVVGPEVERRMVRMRMLQWLSQVLPPGVEGDPGSLMNAVEIVGGAASRPYKHFGFGLFVAERGFDSLQRMLHVGETPGRTLLDEG